MELSRFVFLGVDSFTGQIDIAYQRISPSHTRTAQQSIFVSELLLDK